VPLKAKTAKKSIRLQQEHCVQDATLSSQHYHETITGDDQMTSSQQTSGPVKLVGDGDESVSPYQQSLLNLYTDQV